MVFVRQNDPRDENGSDMPRDGLGLFHLSKSAKMVSGID